ncbi:MAG: hypothetical protein JWP97_1817 [Labilithrix sp.]|nr:hypothetical protein [Labilithrix sp.]
MVPAMRKSLPLLVLLVTAASVPLACGKKEAAVPTMTVDAGLGDGGLSDGGDGGLGDGGMDAGDASSPFGSASAPLGSAVAAGFDSAIDTAIQAQAMKDAPGMQVEGPVNHQTVAEGGTFNALVTLQPGRCYTIIAMSAPLQVATLEMKMLAPPLFNVEAGRSGASDKNPAVIGKGKAATCPVLPIAVPYRVDVTARKGAGRVGVAVFSKAK